MANKKTTKKSSKKSAKKSSAKTSSKKTSKKSLKKTSKKSTKTTVKKKTVKKTVKKTTKKTSTEKNTEKIQKPVEELTEEEKKQKQEEERIESYKKAGEISKKIKEFVKPKIKVGVKLIDLINTVEDKIIELGGKPGFPVNISINHIAAHYTSPPGDTTEINEGDILKFDFGVHIDGYCVDTAFTVSFNDDPALKDLIKASEDAVEKAIQIMKPGVKTNELGALIEKTIKGYGYRPIMNLTGHKLEQWAIHSGKSIPCTATPTGEVIEEGEVYAVEVFATNGEGAVHAQNNSYIFSLNLAVRRIPLRRKSAKRILGYVANEWNTLPFSKLQIYKKFPKGMFGLIELIRSGKLTEYKVLSEEKNKGFYVSQAEETVIITKDSSEIIT